LGWRNLGKGNWLGLEGYLKRKGLEPGIFKLDWLKGFKGVTKKRRFQRRAYLEKAFLRTKGKWLDFLLF